ncbi:hypothetical protein [Mesoplasma florum]|uniref:hypothetical protein n=1 Tax=Mesoplasma florum TaxID=2151 RepID=UPI000D08C3D2|nr:hypothetical protein [Mesoplasma florum]AVN60924.1 hypothetical protein CG005_01290 [Mesoplasma florum]
MRNNCCDDSTTSVILFVTFIFWLPVVILFYLLKWLFYFIRWLFSLSNYSDSNENLQLENKKYSINSNFFKKAQILEVNKEKNICTLWINEEKVVWPLNKLTLNNELKVQDCVSIYVKDNNKISRSSNVFIEKILKNSITDFNDEIIKIKYISRIPGERTKIIVASDEQNFNSAREIKRQWNNELKNISDELENEKIEFINWSSETHDFIKNVLFPIRNIYINELKDEIEIKVPSDQLSKAIGKKGINVKILCGLLKTKIKIYD